jgi:hypothetical protein
MNARDTGELKVDAGVITLIVLIAKLVKLVKLISIMRKKVFSFYKK